MFAPIKTSQACLQQKHGEDSTRLSLQNTTQINQLVQALDGLLVGGLRRLVHLKAHASSSSTWVTDSPSVSLRMVNAVR